VQLQTDAVIFFMQEHLHWRMSLVEPLIPFGLEADVVAFVISSQT